MKEKIISIIINSSIEEVFEFTTNPKNTHLWIDFIEEEVINKYPISIGTQYKNRGVTNIWDTYDVIEFEKNKVFTLRDLEKNYHVRYSYGVIEENKTKMTYFEWSENGELTDPFEKETLETLKKIIENLK
jgi:hypothetical protein